MIGVQSGPPCPPSPQHPLGPEGTPQSGATYLVPKTEANKRAAPIVLNMRVSF